MTVQTVCAILLDHYNNGVLVRRSFSNLGEKERWDKGALLKLQINASVHNRRGSG